MVARVIEQLTLSDFSFDASLVDGLIFDFDGFKFGIFGVWACLVFHDAPPIREGWTRTQDSNRRSRRANLSASNPVNIR